ncbi:hypothetical protein ACFL96_00215 [Thermoproteota archaeon]
MLFQKNKLYLFNGHLKINASRLAVSLFQILNNAYDLESIRSLIKPNHPVTFYITKEVCDIKRKKCLWFAVTQYSLPDKSIQTLVYNMKKHQILISKLIVGNKRVKFKNSKISRKSFSFLITLLCLAGLFMHFSNNKILLNQEKIILNQLKMSQHITRSQNYLTSMQDNSHKTGARLIKTLNDVLPIPMVLDTLCITPTHYWIKGFVLKANYTQLTNWLSKLKNNPATSIKTSFKPIKPGIIGCYLFSKIISEL